MLHSLVTADTALDLEMPEAPAKRAVLRGPVRPDLIRDELLCEIFAATVARSPLAVAMITAGGRLTYAEIDARSEAVARALLRRGARPGRTIGLWMPRGHELLIAQIAIAKTGAAWLPFDAEAQAERVATCLADAEAWGILTTSGVAEKLAVFCPVWTYGGLAGEGAETPELERVDARALGA